MIRMLKKFRVIDWVLLVLLIGIVGGQVYLDLELPSYTSKIIQQMMDPTKTTKDILSTGARMLLICLASGLCSIVIGYIATYIATNFSRRMRLEIFKKVQSFSVEEMANFETSSLITRTTNDVQQVQMAFGMILRIALGAPFTAVGAILNIGKTNLKLSLAVGGTIVSLILMVIIVFVLVMPRFRKMQKLTDRLNDVTRENLSGIRVVRAYTAENYQQEKFKKANDELTHNNLVGNRIMSLMGPAISAVMSAISLVVYWLGADLISKSKLAYPDLASFVSYSMQVLMSFMMVAMLLIMVPRANVCAKRLLEVLDTKNKIENPKYAKQIEGDASIEFKNVSFTYPNGHRPILSNLSFKVSKGETLAIIGSTGSGKTTLMNLIPRFIDVTEGAVLVNGCDIREYNKYDLRDAIGYVPQKRFLFSGDIKSNIKFGDKHITNLQMMEAAHIAMADEFVEKMDETYDSHIAQGGKNVSGGQMQRLCIARAIAKNPSIYLFDDSFSALDYKTDKEVRGRLKSKTKDAVSIIVAQRIGTIKDADKIIVLDEGKMVGYGKHEELLHSCEVYKEIALSQLSKEELGL